MNALTIDVEDERNLIERQWFGVETPPTDAVVTNTDVLLEILADAGTHATFFVLGEVALAYPDLIKRIVGAGHELAVHGGRHLRVCSLSADDFRAEIEPAKKQLEDLTGRAVMGHRAPAFSMNLTMEWAFDVLLELGFAYDSSIHPARERPFCPLVPFAITRPRGKLWEIPPATLQCCGRRWRVCGGGYFRHFPYALNRWALKRINQARPAVVYMHPYEIDSYRFPPSEATFPLRKRLRYRIFSRSQYHNRKRMKNKLCALLGDFQFSTISHVYREIIAEEG